MVADELFKHFNAAVCFFEGYSKLWKHIRHAHWLRGVRALRPFGDGGGSRWWFAA
jgi:hypothetical protein